MGYVSSQRVVFNNNKNLFILLLCFRWFVVVAFFAQNFWFQDFLIFLIIVFRENCCLFRIINKKRIVMLQHRWYQGK